MDYDDEAREAFGSGWGTCVFGGVNDVWGFVGVGGDDFGRLNPHS